MADKQQNDQPDEYQKVANKSNLSDSAIWASYVVEMLIENVHIDEYYKNLEAKKAEHSISQLFSEYIQALWPNQTQPLDCKTDDYKNQQVFPTVKNVESGYAYPYLEVSVKGLTMSFIGRWTYSSSNR